MRRTGHAVSRERLPYSILFFNDFKILLDK